MRAGVVVVCLDHVTEQEHGAAIGVAKLELRVDPHPPLAGEERQEPDQRQGQRDAERRLDRRERDREPHGRETGVDQVDRRHLVELDPWRDP